jgi:rubredoxin/flavin reductase (DIM6/NTAB) family NADH-FMN oxidoreductase RutF
MEEIMSVDNALNLKALRNISYGMYVIGSRKGESLNAQIANTVFQITSEPPTLAVSINKNNLTHEYITSSGVFSVSSLCQDTPLAFIGQFGFKSGRDTSKLEGVNYKIGLTRAPVILDYAVSYFEVEVKNQIDIGTHTIFIGEIVGADDVSDKTCMTYDYYRQMKRGVTPKSAPTFIKTEQASEQATQQKEQLKMAQYECKVCGYIYDPAKGDPDSGIKPGTPFESLPANWVCPVCGAAKTEFEKISGQ